MANPPGVQSISAAALTKVLSPPRLEAYRLSPSDPPRVLIGRYRWNVALCMSLYAPLGYLEVAFRNSLHDALVATYGAPAWYDLVPGWLLAREQDKIAAAKVELSKRNAPLSPDRLVAELNFGFWTSLLSGSYEQVIWPKLLKPVFPHMPRRARTRHTVAGRMNKIRHLRNRVFHHEPIWHWKDLRQQHAALEETIRWFEPALSRILPDAHTFDEVHGKGSVAFEMDVR